MCNSLSPHKLWITNGGRIKCEKCWGMWDMTGSELLPYGYTSWSAWSGDCLKRGFTPASAPETFWSGKNPLSAREIAQVLVSELITRNGLKDPADIKALRNEATQNPDVFIDEVMGDNSY